MKRSYKFQKVTGIMQLTFGAKHIKNLIWKTLNSDWYFIEVGKTFPFSFFFFERVSLKAENKL